MTNSESVTGAGKAILVGDLQDGFSNFRRQCTQVILVVVLTLLSYYLVSHFVLQSVRVVGSSMVPTLQDSDRYLLNRWIYWFRSPERGEIVVLRDPADGGLSVKRIIALEGDTVTLKGAGVYLNGRKLQESYLASGTPTFCNNRLREVVFHVQKEQFFVLGDNRRNSVDSRTYGSVPRDHILGLVVR